MPQYFSNEHFFPAYVFVVRLIFDAEFLFRFPNHLVKVTPADPDRIYLTEIFTALPVDMSLSVRALRALLDLGIEPAEV